MLPKAGFLPCHKVLRVTFKHPSVNIRGNSWSLGCLFRHPEGTFGNIAKPSWAALLTISSKAVFWFRGIFELSCASPLTTLSKAIFCSCDTKVEFPAVWQKVPYFSPAARHTSGWPARAHMASCGLTGAIAGWREEITPRRACPPEVSAPPTFLTPTITGNPDMPCPH